MEFRTFTPVGGLLWYKGSPVCESPIQRLWDLILLYCAPPTVSLRLLLCLWMWGIFFGDFQCLPVDDCSAVSCDSGALSRGSEHTSFYSAVLNQPPHLLLYLFHSPSFPSSFLTQNLAKSRNSENVCCMEGKNKRKKRSLFLMKKAICLLSSKYFVFSNSGAAFFSLGVRVCALEHLTLANSPNSISNQLSYFQFLCGSFMLLPFIDTLTFHGEWVLFSWQPLSGPRL